MSETATPQEVMEAAKAEQARREEAWAEKMINRGKEERGEKEAGAEEVEQNLESRLEDGGVAQISPEFAGTENPVKLQFRRSPEDGTLLYLEKNREVSPEGGAIGFRKFYRAEEPVRGVEKEEGVVYLRAEPVNPEEFEARRLEAEDMREYLTSETLDKLGIPRPESQPEALPA